MARQDVTRQDIAWHCPLSSFCFSFTTRHHTTPPLSAHGTQHHIPTQLCPTKPRPTHLPQTYRQPPNIPINRALHATLSNPSNLKAQTARPIAWGLSPFFVGEEVLTPDKEHTHHWGWEDDSPREGVDVPEGYRVVELRSGEEVALPAGGLIGAPDALRTVAPTEVLCGAVKSGLRDSSLKFCGHWAGFRG